MTILWKWQIWQKCKQDYKRGMLIIVGFTKMTYFAKLANLVKDSLHVKAWKKIKWENKRGILTVGDFRENGKFKKTGNWARIHQRFGKTSIDVTKRGNLTLGDYNKKTANLGENVKFRQKWRVCQKFNKGLAKYSNEITKRGILTNGDFTKMTNLEKII